MKGESESYSCIYFPCINVFSFRPRHHTQRFNNLPHQMLELLETADKLQKDQETFLWLQRFVSVCLLLAEHIQPIFILLDFSVLATVNQFQSLFSLHCAYQWEVKCKNIFTEWSNLIKMMDFPSSPSNRSADTSWAWLQQSNCTEHESLMKFVVG